MRLRWRALKPGGLIVLEAFTPEQIEQQRAGARGGPRDAALLYSAEDLREDFAGAEIVELDRSGGRSRGRGAARRAERRGAGDCSGALRVPQQIIAPVVNASDSEAIKANLPKQLEKADHGPPTRGAPNRRNRKSREQ